MTRHLTMRPPLGHRSPATRLLVTCLLAIGLLGLPAAAPAYELIDLPWPCGVAKWADDPTFGFLEISFSTKFQRDAVREPGLRVNAVGGQWFDVASWTIHADNEPKNKRSEIWKTEGLGLGVTGLTSYNTSFCKFRQTDIRFATTAQASWHHAEPGHYGVEYWIATETGDRQFLRQTAMHELLHAAGLDHEDNTYAFTTYGTLPFANRGAGLQVEPLPDDRRGLRALYGTGGSERDVAVLNTWVLPFEDFVGLGIDTCSPSTGSGFSQNWASGGRCGDDFSTSVCPGDRVYTAYTIANHGTETANTTQRLYFSSGPWLSNDDVLSPTVWQRSVSKNVLEPHSFVVPDGIAPGTYWPLIKIETDLDESGESTQNNWIPLRDQVTVPASCYTSGGIDWP